MSKKLKYYIIGYEDAQRLGVVGFRQGTQKDGYVVNSDDFSCVTDDFLERAIEITEIKAVEFVKSLRNE